MKEDAIRTVVKNSSSLHMQTFESMYNLVQSDLKHSQITERKTTISLAEFSNLKLTTSDETISNSPFFPLSEN